MNVCPLICTRILKGKPKPKRHNEYEPDLLENTYLKSCHIFHSVMWTLFARTSDKQPTDYYETEPSSGRNQLQPLVGYYEPLGCTRASMASTDCFCAD